MDGIKNVRKTLSLFTIMRKPVFDGYPIMLVGYMRVSSDSDRQNTDLQRDALLAAGVDVRHFSRISHPARRMIDRD